MFFLRRAASRALSTRSIAATQQRTFVTRTSSALRQTSQWQLSSYQTRFASNEASPTDAQTSGETVTTEPSEAETVEKSIAEPDVADAAQPSTQAESAVDSVKESVQDAAQSVRETIKTTATQAAQKVSEAAPGIAALNAASNTSSGRRNGRDSYASSSFTQPEPNKILYVGNLFFETTAAQLEREFSNFGTIVNSKIATDPKGLSKGFGYVEFDDVESATAAIKALDQQVFQGRRMAVQYHVQRQPRHFTQPSEPNAPSKTLFIGNMSFQMSDKDLNDLFREVRNVLDVRVAIDRRSGQPRGFAHADFLDVASAEKAKKYLEGKTVYGRALRIDFSKSSTRAKPQDNN